MISNIKAEHDRARVTASWAKLKWETHRSGGVGTYCDGWGIDIQRHPSGEGFVIVISRVLAGNSQRGRKVYPSIEEAKIGCLEAVYWAIKNMAQSGPEHW